MQVEIQLGDLHSRLPAGHYFFPEPQCKPLLSIIAVDSFEGDDAYAGAIVGMVPFAVAYLGSDDREVDARIEGRFVAIYFRPAERWSGDEATMKHACDWIQNNPHRRIRFLAAVKLDNQSSTSSGG
jgi:hypothetical protein